MCACGVCVRARVCVRMCTYVSQCVCVCVRARVCEVGAVIGESIGQV